jgi:hypothetical protein
VNRLRKIAKWLWLGKERMVLAVMVGFLCYRVYQVVFPREDGTHIETPPIAKTTPPPPEFLPGDPPPPPPRRTPEIWASLYTRNMFVYRSSGGGTQGTDDQGSELRLLRIVPGNPPRAQIQSGPNRKFYLAGDQFESYQVLEINVEEGTVIVYAENRRRRETLTVRR